MRSSANSWRNWFFVAAGRVAISKEAARARWAMSRMRVSISVGFMRLRLDFLLDGVPDVGREFGALLLDDCGAEEGAVMGAVCEFALL